MNKHLCYGTLVASCLLSSLAHAGELDNGSKIQEVSTYSDARSTFISVKTDGTGTGPCAGSWIRFPDTGDEQEEHVRSLVLAAFLAGKSVQIESASGTNCDQADYIRVTN